VQIVVRSPWLVGRSPASIASRTDEPADGRPFFPGQPIRLTLRRLMLATLGHAPLAGPELDERRLAERIDLWAGAAPGS
jgi:hypothetical protein